MAAAPSEEMLASTEECAAKATLAATSGSVAAYDKVPLAAASCLFTMDTSTNIFLMHSFQVGRLVLTRWANSYLLGVQYMRHCMYTERTLQLNHTI